MMIKSVFFLYLIVSFIIINNIALVSSSTKLEATFCLEKGFDSTTLICENCGLMKDVLAREDFYDECLQCCTDKVEDSLYAKAIYISDRRFLNKDLKKSLVALKKVKNLRVVIKTGYYPKLQLFEYIDGEGEDEAEEININRWSDDQLVEFIKEKLVDKDAPPVATDGGSGISGRQESGNDKTHSNSNSNADL